MTTAVVVGGGPNGLAAPREPAPHGVAGTLRVGAAEVGGGGG